jgi:hypothetical protein
MSARSVEAISRTLAAAAEAQSFEPVALRAVAARVRRQRRAAAMRSASAVASVAVAVAALASLPAGAAPGGAVIGGRAAEDLPVRVPPGAAAAPVVVAVLVVAGLLAVGAVLRPDVRVLRVAGAGLGGGSCLAGAWLLGPVAALVAVQAGVGDPLFLADLRTVVLVGVGLAAAGAGLVARTGTATTTGATVTTVAATATGFVLAELVRLGLALSPAVGPRLTTTLVLSALGGLVVTAGLAVLVGRAGRPAAGRVAHDLGLTLLACGVVLAWVELRVRVDAAGGLQGQAASRLVVPGALAAVSGGLALVAAGTSGAVRARVLTALSSLAGLVAAFALLVAVALVVGAPSPLFAAPPAAEGGPWPLVAVLTAVAALVVAAAAAALADPARSQGAAAMTPPRP